MLIRYICHVGPISLLYMRWVVEVVLVLNETPLHEDLRRSDEVAPRIVNLGTRWSWVVSFTLRPLYFQEKGCQYTLDRRLGGTRRLHECGGEVDNLHCELLLGTWLYFDLSLQHSQLESLHSSRNLWSGDRVSTSPGRRQLIEEFLTSPVPGFCW
jgi:hypothetical protein